MSSPPPDIGTPGLPAYSRRSGLLPGLVILVGDVLLLPLLVTVSISIRNLLIPDNPLYFQLFDLHGFHLATLAVPLGFAIAGLYPGYGLNPIDRLRLRVSITLLAISAVIMFDYLAQNGYWSRGTLLITMALAVVVLPAWEAIAITLLRRRNLWGCGVAVFGAPAQRANVAEWLAMDPDLGWIAAEEAEWPPTADAARRGIRVAVVVPPPGAPVTQALDPLPYSQIVLVPDLGPVQSQSVIVRAIGPGILVLAMRRNMAGGMNALVKRGGDILLGSLGLLVALPAIALGGLAVKLASPGPAFFAQQRSGRDGQRFRLWKIRTMVPDAEQRLQAVLDASPKARAAWEKYKKLDHDPRVIPGVGHLLRRCSIDELPQLWNVLRGDMSLVGPRPLPDYHETALEEEMRRTRRLVRPGITGLWQISGRSDLDQARMEYLDAIYIRNWSLWLDLHILLKTVVEVLMARGAR